MSKSDGVMENIECINSDDVVKVECANSNDVLIKVESDDVVIKLERTRSDDVEYENSDDIEDKGECTILTYNFGKDCPAFLERSAWEKEVWILCSRKPKNLNLPIYIKCANVILCKGKYINSLNLEYVLFDTYSFLPSIRLAIEHEAYLTHASYALSSLLQDNVWEHVDDHIKDSVLMDFATGESFKFFSDIRTCIPKLVEIFRVCHFSGMRPHKLLELYNSCPNLKHILQISGKALCPPR